MRDLRDKVVLVTGGAGGIGRETALAFAREGARVVICDVDEAGLARTAADLGERLLMARRVDVSVAAEMEALAEAVHAVVPAVDVLVNNAGVGVQATTVETPLDDWRWILGVNLGGVVHGVHFFVPRMIARGAGGAVVNVSSVLGYFGAPGVSAYVTTKHAVFGLSESLRGEIAHKGITVSCVCPGVIATGIVRSSRFHGPKGEAVRGKIDAMYAKRAYGPEHVAAAIVSATKRGTPVVPVSPEAWALWYATRWAPPLARRFGIALAKRFREK